MPALRGGMRTVKWSIAVWIRVACVAATAAAAATDPAAQAPERSDLRAAADLTFSIPVHRDLAGGQAHLYRVAIVDPGSRVEVEIEQRGVRPIVIVYAPDDSELAHGRAAAARDARATIA